MRDEPSQRWPGSGARSAATSRVNGKSMTIDLTKPPEIEYDDDCVTLHWFAADKTRLFSLVIHDGCLIGCNSSIEPPHAAPWKVEIPKGLVKVDHTVMTVTADKRE